MNSPHEFRRLLAGVRALQRDHFAPGAAMATLIGIDGAAFRRPGARMVVRADGERLCGLSVGCAEADLIARAREVIARGHALTVEHDQDRGMDVLLEMGCGGALRTLIEPLATPADVVWVDHVEELMRDRRPGVMATLFARDGECLPRPRRLIWSQEIVLDELEPVGLVAPLMPIMQASFGAARAKVHALVLGAAEFSVFVETLQPPLRVVIVGDNPSARALAVQVVQLGWGGEILTHQPPQQAGEPALPLRSVRPGEWPVDLVPDDRTAVVIMTHNMQHDIDYLRRLADTPVAYLGAISSRARAEKLREATGLKADRLRAPAGLDIRAETPEEIALAIAAEIQARFAGGGGRPLHSSAESLH